MVGGSVEGAVTQVGLFNTIITSLDNVQTIVGNSKMSGDMIRSHSSHVKYGTALADAGKAARPVGMSRSGGSCPCVRSCWRWR